MSLKERIESAWTGDMDAEAVEETISRLDRGELRVAEKRADQWIVHDWVKKAILLYFRLSFIFE